MDYRAYAQDMLKFINSSPCGVWAVNNGIEMLKNAGFCEYTGEAETGSKYYIQRGGTALAAFIKGGEKGQLRIGAAHADSPAIMIKPQCEIINEGTYVRLNAEIYGGAILSTWLDRPLGIAGRVMLKSDKIMPDVKLYKSNRPLCIIPNCAPHLNKEINNGFVYNKQRDMLPLISLNPQIKLKEIIADDLGIEAESILDYELYCYDVSEGIVMGADEDMLSVGRLDDLMMCYSLLRAICEADTENTALVLLTDNEEVGSLSLGGARGNFPTEVIKVVVGNNYSDKLKNAVAFSADLAHAVNPSHPELHEPLSRPYINRGMVLKRAANKGYSTDGISGAVFKNICDMAGLSYQEFVNPSDRPGGTTIGPMLSAVLGISVADIGAPIMSMHSIRELGGIRDAGDSYLLFKALFEI